MCKNIILEVNDPLIANKHFIRKKNVLLFLSVGNVGVHNFIIYS